MMATISSGSDTGVVHDYDPGTGDTSGIIIVGDCDSGPALETYIALRQMGMNVCLIEREPDPEPEPFFPVECMDIPAWPELYGGAPHRVPNHYPPAPKKLIGKSAPLKINHRIKQPGKLPRGNRS